jgi:hypothetical protein
VAVGRSAQYLRALLKALSEKTWNYVAWLTHARSAGRPDAQIALATVSQTVEAFIVAVDRHQLGTPKRCPVCASYRLRAEHDGGSNWIKVCETCGWEAPAEPDPPSGDHDLAGRGEEAEEAGSQPAPEGVCVEPRDLGIYLSPDQAHAVLEQASQRATAESAQEDWANPSAFFFPEDASLADVHRIAYTTFLHAPAEGTELAYACDEAACINPSHAREIPLPGEAGWTCGIVKKVICRPKRLELHISTTHSNGSRRVFVDHAILDRYGLGDASSLTERVMFFAQPDNQGWVHLLPVQRRTDYSDGSTTTGWLHPADAVTDDQDCPCGSEHPYSACHGVTNSAGDHAAS